MDAASKRIPWSLVGGQLALIGLLVCSFSSSAEARKCGRDEQKVLAEVEEPLAPLADVAPGEAELTSSQSLASLRLSGLTSCDGALGHRARLLSLRVRVAQGELHVLLQEMSDLEVVLEAAGDDSNLAELRRLETSLKLSGRLASEIELSLFGNVTHIGRTGKPQVLESDGSAQVRVRLLDGRGQLVGDAAPVELRSSFGSVGELSAGSEGAGSLVGTVDFGELGDSTDITITATLSQLNLSNSLTFRVVSREDARAAAEAVVAQEKRAREAEEDRRRQQEVARRKRETQRRLAAQQEAAAAIVPAVVLETSLIIATIATAAGAASEWRQAQEVGREFSLDAGLSEADVDDIFMRGDQHAQRTGIAATISALLGTIGVPIGAALTVAAIDRYAQAPTDAGPVYALTAGVAPVPAPNGGAAGFQLTLRGEW